MALWRRENLGAVQRQCKNLKELVKEIDALKLRVEQAMFRADKCAEEVEKWSSSVEGPIAEADGEISSLETWLQQASKEVEDQNKGMKKKGELVLVKRSLISRENK